MALTECANGHLYDSEQYPSCPYCGGNMNRMEFSAAPDFGPGKTVGVAGGLDRDAGKTVAVLHKNFSREPVTGWLVCIEGAEKGKDYRIAAKNNTIGRSETMDICIKGDSTISRENHARLSYDSKHNNFYLIPAESMNNIYINDEPIFVPTQIKKDDVIELGESKFLFIPFCDDMFTWQDGLKQKG